MTGVMQPEQSIAKLLPVLSLQLGKRRLKLPWLLLLVLFHFVFPNYFTPMAKDESLAYTCMIHTEVKASSHTSAGHIWRMKCKTSHCLNYKQYHPATLQAEILYFLSLHLQRTLFFLPLCADISASWAS